MWETDMVSWMQSYVLIERFCQNPSENCFGQQCSSGARKDNPSLYDFGYNDNTIQNQKVFKPIAIGNEIDMLNEIDKNRYWPSPMPQKVQTKQPLIS